MRDLLNNQCGAEFKYDHPHGAQPTLTLHAETLVDIGHHGVAGATARAAVLKSAPVVV